MIDLILSEKKLTDVDNEFLRAAHERLKETVGSDIAFFMVCGVANVPYRPKIPANDWQTYIARLRDAWTKDFKEGETDIRGAVSRGMSEKERWVADWGIGNPEKKYTDDVYRQLDAIYDRLSQRTGDGMDAQTEMTLRYCAKLVLARDRFTMLPDKESIDKAAKIDGMIQKNLEGENLRRKDAGNQVARLDGIVDAMKRKFGYGPEMTRDQAIEACSRWLVSHHYSCTRDAAEQSLLAIINATRINSDLPTLPSLPDEADLAKFENEFEKAYSEAGRKEKEVYDYLGLRKKTEKPLL